MLKESAYWYRISPVRDAAGTCRLMEPGEPRNDLVHIGSLLVRFMLSRVTDKHMSKTPLRGRRLFKSDCLEDLRL